MLNSPSCQLPLPLTTQDHYFWETFVLSKSNEEAFSYLRSWPQWDPFCTLLLGPPGSGKTHLSNAWAKETGALEIFHLGSLEKNLESLEKDNIQSLLIDPLPFPITSSQEEILFHIYNAIKRKQGRLLITLNIPLLQYNIQLQDLLSRFKAAYLISLKDPDDFLVKGLIMKNFSQHQLRLPPKTLDYLSVRIKRQYAEIHKITKTLIQESFAQKSPVTIPFVKGVLSI